MIDYTLLTFDEVSSTSDLLKEHFSSFPNFTFLRANHQTKGRGQYERVWSSEKDQNILFSILLKDIDIKHIQALKKWIIHSISTLLKSYQIETRFKEPNDIYANNLKICGILFETRSYENRLDYIVIGIGLNVNQIEFSSFQATSMRDIRQQQFNLDYVFDELLQLLVHTFLFN